VRKKTPLKKFLSIIMIIQKVLSFILMVILILLRLDKWQKIMLLINYLLI